MKEVIRQLAPHGGGLTLGNMLKEPTHILAQMSRFFGIWFLPTRKTQTKNQKSLSFCQRSTEMIKRN